MKQKKKRWFLLACFVFLLVFLLLICLIVYEFTQQRKSSHTMQKLQDEVLIMDGLVGQSRQDVKEEKLDNSQEGNVAPLQPVDFEKENLGVTSEEIPNAIDFDKLTKDNADTAAWLYQSQTQINYPVLQGNDNEFYVDHLYDGTQNASGSLFLDCRNAKDFSDGYSIIFGHNMNNGSMFGSLKKYRKQVYFDNYPKMYFYTPEGRFEVLLVAGMQVDAYDTLYKVPQGDNEKEQIIQRFIENSVFVSNVETTAKDSLLLLSTCVKRNSDQRFVLLGKIIMQE